MEYKKILVAVDDSTFSIKAAEAAFSLAHALKSALAIVYVIDTSKEVVNPDLGITRSESRIVLLEEAENTIRQFISMYNGIENIFRFMPEGHPEKEILRMATEWNADLIIMGSHGRSGLIKLFAGSVAEYVVKHAAIPVMIIPPGVK